MANSFLLTIHSIPRLAPLVFRIFHAPGDTQKIFELAQVLAKANPRKKAKILERCFAEPEFERQYKANYMPQFPDAAAIAGLAEGSLAAHHWRFMQENMLGNLPHPEMAPTEPFNYLRLRIYRVHDLWHTLLGLGISAQDEMALQAFSYGQLRSAVSLLLVLIGLAHFMAYYPLKFPSAALRMWRYFNLGRRAKFLLPLLVEEYLPRSLEEVRSELFPNERLPAPR